VRNNFFDEIAEINENFNNKVIFFETVKDSALIEELVSDEDCKITNEIVDGLIIILSFDEKPSVLDDKVWPIAKVDTDALYEWLDDYIDLEDEAEDEEEEEHNEEPYFIK